MHQIYAYLLTWPISRSWFIRRTRACKERVTSVLRHCNSHSRSIESCVEMRTCDSVFIYEWLNIFVYNLERKLRAQIYFRVNVFNFLVCIENEYSIVNFRKLMLDNENYNHSHYNSLMRNILDVLFLKCRSMHYLFMEITYYS